MAAARVVHCELQAPRFGPEPDSSSTSGPDQVKMVSLSRPCTLKSSYASDHRRGGMVKRMMTAMMRRQQRRRRRSSSDQEIISAGDDHDHDGALDRPVEEELELSPILENLFESIESSSSKKSYYFEIITGRLAMIIFGVTVGVELATGDSIFNKIDAQGLAEGLVGCLAATAAAAFLARSSTARKKVVRIFAISFNVFFEALIDNILDGLFLETDLDDPSDDNFN